MREGVNYNLELRMRQLIHTVLQGRPHWTRLEELTGTKAIRWRQFVAGIKNPTVEMIEALCSVWPQYAFWLVTGISDEDAGHLAPNGLSYPGRLPRGELPKNEQEATISYFKTCQQTAPSAWDELVSAIEERTGEETTKLRMADARLGLGEWLRSDDLATRLSRDTHDQLIKKMTRQQRSHLEQTLLRLRIYNRDADAIIDNQRSEDDELERELEELRAKKNGNKKD